MKEINLLEKSFLNSKFFDSRIKTNSVSRKEKILGHLIGPLGLILVVNTVAALVEKFFTQQVGALYGQENVEMISVMGGKYEVVMTVAKVLAMFTGILISWLISHTKTKQGRLRPWYLIFSFISIIIGATIFLFSGDTLGDNYWYYFFFLLICYHTVGTSYFLVFRDNIVSLSSRNAREKTQLTFFRKLSWTLLSGILIGMLVSSVVIPFWLQYDIKGYAELMIGVSIVAIPLVLMEYFYTRERVIEDVAEEKGLENENKVPLIDQMKALFTNKYWVILNVLILLQGIVDQFKGGNVQYFYIQYMLGGMDNNFMQVIYQIVTGVPLGIGAFAIYPLAKKIGIKNLTIIGYSLVLCGSILGWIFPDQMVPALIGGFLRNIGWMPNSYIFITLLCFAFDSIEYKSHVRLEGLMGTGIVTAVMTLIYAPFAGGYESAILRLGFVDVPGIVPSEEVKAFMTLAFYLFDIILAAAFIILLPFVDVEKKMPKITAELLRRKKEAILAKGEEWIEPEEQDRLEQEREAKELEENRIADLRARCAKKGLDFETENAKYLAKQAEKERKQQARLAKKQAKRK
ncbi:MAG TPA: MFS transporter [Candidatus Fimivicinus intestinavium]|nr:MFS transporter [Candidatus Fimivicinus intestinavium]